MAPTSPNPPTSDRDTDARWRAQIARELRGKTLEDLTRPSEDGFSIPPLFTGLDLHGLDCLDAAPGQGLHARGFDSAPTPWRCCPELDVVSPAQLVQHAREEAGRGVSLGWCEVWADPRRGRTNARAAWRFDELVHALQGAQRAGLELRVATGEIASPLAASLGLLDGEGRRCGLMVDFWSQLALTGHRGADESIALEEFASTIAWADAREDVDVWLMASSLPFHNAGATVGQELGIAMALLVGSLRSIERGDTNFEACLDRMHLRLSVGRDIFMEIAKFRAARVLWSQVMGTSGFGAGLHRLEISARGSSRDRTAMDPWGNLLRGTTESFAAVLGGADMVTTVPLHDALDADSEMGRRLATNIQVLLDRESHLGKVADAGGGSYYIESLTDTLAREGWRWFQKIESKGGIEGALQSGELQGWLSERFTERAARVATRALPVVGVSDFAIPQDAPIRDLHPRPSRTRRGRSSELAPKWSRGRPVQVRASVISVACLGDVWDALAQATPSRAGCLPLPQARLSAPFEHLRARVAARRRPLETWVVEAGEGAIVAARRDFTRNALAVAGIDPVRRPLDALTPSDTSAAYGSPTDICAVICLDDGCSDEALDRLVGRVREAGAAVVFVAGAPRGGASAPDGYLHRGADLVDSLARLTGIAVEGGVAR